MEYTDEQLIAEAGELKRQNDNVQWAWGDWALRCEPMGVKHTITGSKGRLQKLLSKLHVEWGDNSLTLNMVMDYRKISNKFPEGVRNPSSPYGIYQIAYRAGWGPDELEANLPPSGQWNATSLREAINQSLVIHCSECCKPTGKTARNFDEAKGLSKSALCQECLHEAKPEPVRVAAVVTAVTRRKPTVSPTDPPGAEVEESKPRPIYKAVPETPEQRRARAAKGREIHREGQHQAMLNGLPRSFNNILANQVQKVSALLGDLSSHYTPREAADQINAGRLHYFTDVDRGEWLAEFFRECEKRRQAEAPEARPISPRSEESMKAEMARARERDGNG